MTQIKLTPTPMRTNPLKLTLKLTPKLTPSK